MRLIIKCRSVSVLMRFKRKDNREEVRIIPKTIICLRLRNSFSSQRYNHGLFDAKKKFDTDFIRSYLNILRESIVGFRLLSDSPADQTLRTRALNILSLNTSAHHKISSLLTRNELST